MLFILRLIILANISLLFTYFIRWKPFSYLCDRAFVHVRENTYDYHTDRNFSNRNATWTWPSYCPRAPVAYDTDLTFGEIESTRPHVYLYVGKTNALGALWKKKNPVRDCRAYKQMFRHDKEKTGRQHVKGSRDLKIIFIELYQ